MKWIKLASIALVTMVRVSAQSTVESYKDWTYLGCFGDTTLARSLHHFVGGFPFLTVQDCLDKCDGLGFGFGGLEYNHECFCGNALLYDYGCSENCYAACSGDSTQICGGPNALSVYENGKVPFTEGPAEIVPGYKNWVFTQCWQDDKWQSAGGRRLLPNWPNAHVPAEGMTVEKCIDGCEASGYSSAGLEFGQECWCGNVTYPLGQSASPSECNMPCTSNAEQICGGPNRIVVLYSNTKSIPIGETRYWWFPHSIEGKSIYAVFTISQQAQTPALIVIYILLNFFAVRYYGESEFWLSLGKVTLMVGLIVFTFLAILGVNPIHDRFGFRYWQPKNVPGAPFAEYISTGSLGHFHGFAACFIQAALIIVGPDYVAIAAGEAKNPRETMTQAFRTTFYRLTTFFVLGAFCVGTLVPYSDPDLVKSVTNPEPGVGASPFVIAMRRLHIKALPDIVNAMVLTSIFSAGNTYFYIGSRILFGLALEGKALKILARCNKRGVPVYGVGIMVLFSLLAFMQVSEKGTIVLNWLLNLLSSAGILVRAFISLAYIRFYKAMKVQGISRKELPHRTNLQPFSVYYSMIALIFIVIVYQYPLFLKGRWNTVTFIFSYGILVIVPILYFGWKIWKGAEITLLQEIHFFEKDRAHLE